MPTAPAPWASAGFRIPAAGLPTHLTSFIGREPEIAALGDLMRSARLVTLTGVGGAGKTRLAAAVAARVAPAFEVTAWVDLASLADPALVDQVVATALGFREEGGRSAVATMVDGLCERSTLVILDNCEHLVAACAAVADSLLADCPTVQILATSREALGVSGEHTWLVPPLALPAAGATAAGVLDSEAGQLFLSRARAALPSFGLDDAAAPAVAQICRRLDGIPLAIELAAARARVLTPQQIADRLGEAFTVLAASGRSTVARHRTLREAIDWSYALLDDAEACLFRGLAVFGGSFSLDAVEALWPADGLDLLSALVDKSLVVMEAAGSEARYRLLETLRQYALQKLEAANEEQTQRRRHAHFFTELVASREKDTFGGAGGAAWDSRLTDEVGNLRAACDWTLAAGDYTAHLRLCSALHWHWYARGHFREGWARLETALEHAEHVPPLHAGKAYAAAATTAYFVGRLDRIVPRAERAVALLRDQDDPWHLTYAVASLGLGLCLTDPAAAQPTLAEATALARAHAPCSVLLAFALYWQGRHALEQGDLDRAERILSEGHAVGRAVGHPPAIAHALAMLGFVLVERGALDTAATHLCDALAIHAGNADILGCLWSIEGLARIAHRTGALERAALLLAFARTERDRLGTAWSPPERRVYDALAESLERQLGSPAYAAPVARGETMSMTDAVALLLAAGPETIPPSPPTVPALTLHTLGPLRVRKNGEPLEREAWASAKARELLLFLVCHPGGGTREEVGLAFWPDASAEQVRNNFHVTLHRLRKTLGDARWVTHAGGVYALNPALPIAWDATTFERDTAAGLARLARSGDAALLESALALYQGDFLEHEPVGDWHLTFRDRLRLTYLAALTALAEHDMQRGRWARAADTWRTLVAREALDERAYRGLMTCHARLGERSQVRQLFQRLERMLERELEAKPALETVRLYHELVTPGDGSR